MESCGRATISTCSSVSSSRQASSARSSFSSSAARKAPRPCIFSGSQTLRPRQSRDSSGEISQKSTSSGSAWNWGM